MNKSSSMMASIVGLVSNVFLTIIKILCGLIFQSSVLLADGLHNAGDVIASIATYSSMKISKIPADNDHPYGHGKAEVISSFLVALVLLIASLLIAYHSLLSFFEPPKTIHLIVLITMFISYVWKHTLYIYTFKIAKNENSKALFAMAYDHLADIYASIAGIIGISLAFIGSIFNIPILAYGDPLAGIVVSFFVIRLSWHLGKESIDILMEKNISEEIIKDYSTLIWNIHQVKRIDRIRAREHGSYILIDVRISILGTLTVQEGHDVAKEVKNIIIDSHSNVGEVLVHINPWYEKEDNH